MEKQKIWQLISKKLSGEAQEEELRELEQELRNNPDLHYPMQAVIDLWNADCSSSDAEAERNFNRHIQRMKLMNIEFDANGLYQEENPGNSQFAPAPSKKRKKIRVFTLLCCMLLVAAAFLVFYRNVTPSNSQAGANLQKANSEISTRNGSRTNVVLPDGTIVWLNAGSRLTYDKNYGNAIREVNLTGEAFFDVVHNAEKPFVIHAAKMNIKVLGTRFDVKSYPADKTTEATLIRGSIEVSFKDRPSEKIILKPNEKIVVANSDENPEPTRELKQDNKILANPPMVAIRNLTYEVGTGSVVETSWMENKLIFQDESFKDLASQMERWYGVTIRFDDLKKEELQFTGSFRNETIQQALEELIQTAPLDSPPFGYSIGGTEIKIF